MTDLFQSPSDRVLWILAHHGGKMMRSRLKAAMGMRYAYMNPILEELARKAGSNYLRICIPDKPLDATLLCNRTDSILMT